MPPLAQHAAPIRLFAALAAAAALGSCQGTVTLPGETDTVGPVSDFNCVETPAEELPLRRLTGLQHRNSIESVLARYYDTGDVETIMGSLGPALGTRPNEFLQESPEEPGQRLFARSDQTISDDLVRADLRIAEAVGAEMTANAARIEAWAGTCATDGDASNDASCLDDIVDSLGRLTHRRPLSDAERSFYRDEAYIDGDTIVAQGLAELVTVMFAQPAFVFHLEGGDGQLTAYETAARLSYHFWNDMPDEALLAAAQDGSLLTDEVWSSEVMRVASDARAESSVREFLSQWLKLDRVAPLSTGSGNALEALRGGLTLDRELDQAIVEEIVDLFLYLLRNGGTFRDFFLSDQTLTESAQLASIYGVSPAADGGSVTVPAERVGVLSRAGLLLPRSDITPPGPGPRTHPILRGVFIKRQILCDRIDPPPAGAMDDLPEVDQTSMTSREGAELLTGEGICRGCHASLNAPGFAFEQFDALTRFRTEERLFDADGNEVGSRPVDATAELPELEGAVEGGAALSQALYETELPGACFVRHYARYALGRPEDVRGADSCILQQMDEAIDEDRPLVEVLSMIVLDPRFQVRHVE